MFEEFAKINISGTNNGNIDKTKELNKSNDYNNVNSTKKIIHGKNVIFKNGQYKGYLGFVCEFNLETCDVEVEDYNYVKVSDYGEYANGDVIMTMMGKAVIIDKIDKMYSLRLKEKGNVEVNLFKDQVARFFCIYEDNMKKIVYVKREYTDNNEVFYDIVKINMDYKKYYNNEELMKMLSSVVVNGMLKSVMKETVKGITLSGEEFWMVTKTPTNKSDVNYIGKFGKLLKMIDEQYLIKYKKVIIAPYNFVTISGKDVTFNRGCYKNQKGTLKNTNGSNLVIDICAIGKKMSSHLVRGENGYKISTIVPEDLFFKDIELSNGNYFNVINCTNNGYFGIEKVKNQFIEKEVKEDDIKQLMPGFFITSNIRKMTMPKDDCTMEMDIIEENLEETDDKEQETGDGSYNDNGDIDIRDQDIVYESEVEMKQSFKDIERLEFVQRVLSKEEKNIMKFIEKCVSALSLPEDSIKIYKVLEKVNDAINKMKCELSKLSINDWKVTDTKYVIACLIIYEIVKSGYNFTKGNFTNCITTLYDTSFFKKGDITESIFIRVDKQKNNIETIFDSIVMDDIKQAEMKRYYKTGKIVEIIKLMMSNCNIILQDWFGSVILSCLDEQVITFPVSRKIKDISKKFLTTKDVLNDNMVEGADRVLWGPSTLKMIKIWKTSLIKKCEDESDKRLKSIYNFVIDNFERAPLILREMESKVNNNLEILQYKELKRAFTLFITKLKKFNTRVELEKIEKSTRQKNERDRISKRRNEIEMENLNISFEKKIKVF